MLVNLFFSCNCLNLRLLPSISRIIQSNSLYFLTFSTNSMLELHRNSWVTSMVSVLISTLTVSMLISSDLLLSLSIDEGIIKESISSYPILFQVLTLLLSSIIFILIVSFSFKSNPLMQSHSSCSFILLSGSYAILQTFDGFLLLSVQHMDSGARLTSSYLLICWKLIGLSFQYLYFLWRLRQEILRQQFIVSYSLKELQKYLDGLIRT